MLSDGLEQAIEKRQRVVVNGTVHFAGENVIRAKPGRNRHHLFQAQAEQRGASQEDESERDLRDDKAVAKPLRRATDRAGARFGLERVRERLPRLNQATGSAISNSENDRTGEADRREPAIERDLRAER